MATSPTQPSLGAVNDQNLIDHFEQCIKDRACVATVNRHISMKDLLQDLGISYETLTIGQTRSTILTSHSPVSRWHEQIGDPTIADGIHDRLVHNAHRIDMRGKSMRKKRNPRDESDEKKE